MLPYVTPHRIKITSFHKEQVLFSIFTSLLSFSPSLLPSPFLLPHLAHLFSSLPDDRMPSHQPTAGHMAVQPQFLSSQPSVMAKTSEPNRSKSHDPRKPHITDMPITKSNWYKHINWLNVTLIVAIPLYGSIQAFWVSLQWRTALFAVVYYFMTGLGITAGKPASYLSALVSSF